MNATPQSDDARDGPDPSPIAPAGFTPPPLRNGGGTPPQPPAPRRRWPWLLLPLLLCFALGIWFLLTARPVTLVFEPEADAVSVHGGFHLPMGERRLMRPGDYRLRARAAGHHPLEAEFRVSGEGDNRLAFAFEPLPGRLAIRSEPEDARVEIDGEARGRTPLEVGGLAPGEHEVVLRAPRHQDHRQTVTIVGRDELQHLQATLVPAWAEITVRSRPAGAELLVDGEAVGETPLTAEIGAGSRSLELRLAGYESWQRELEVEANEPQTLPEVTLQRERGQLQLASTPAGASVTVDGRFVGRTPLTVPLAPETPAELRLSLAGHKPARREVTLASGESERLELRLEPVTGEIRVRATPPDAELRVNGEARGRADQTLELLAVPQRITVSKPGFQSFETTVTPQPGTLQQIRPTLLSEAEAQAARLPARITTAEGQTMVLIRPEGVFTMGASRRQQGRRANETERRVRLTRPYYMSVHEISNADFRAFRRRHSSGIVARETLDNERQPAVRVSWEQAVAFCNWLSDRDGLPPAYQGGRLVTPPTTGYRLPSEAEWAYAARFAGGRNDKYPWGDSMPPPQGAGNFADASAAELLPQVLPNYDDGRPATAPVGSYRANAMGIFDLGGNVSEWVHDYYSAPLLPPAEVQEDPFGPESGNSRVIRGSSWRHSRITELRLSWRDEGSEPRDDLGFRIVRYAE